MTLDGLLAGRYKIIKPLGRGGFGQTYLAEDTQFPGNRTCVVKQLKPQVENPEFWQDANRLFQREAEILSHLGEHNQIPRLLAHFEENQEFFLVQELIEGEDLSHEFKPGQSFNERYVLALLDNILEVLEFVHQQGVIHRDIKPSNIMRRRQDSKIILIDFGAVKAIGLQTTLNTTPQTAHTISICTPGYTPNEQYSGQPKLSSDVYAVGMVGIQALTGRLPTEFPRDPETGELIWHDQVQVSPQCAAVIDKMVLYDFRQRYADATQARQALQPLLYATNTTTVNTTVPNLPSPVLETVPQAPPTRPQATDPQAMSAPVPAKPQRRIPFRTFIVGTLLGLMGGVAGTLYAQSKWFSVASADKEPEVSALPPIETPSINPQSAPVGGASPEPIGAGTPVVVDYTPLRTALAAGQWKVADQITRDNLLSVTGRSGSVLRVEDVEQIPCRDLNTINQFWKQASQGRFGFMAQQQVWQTLVAQPPQNSNVEQPAPGDKVLAAFVERSGWFYRSYPTSSNLIAHEYGELTFALNGPPGHLPARMYLQTDAPNDSTQLRGAAMLIPTIAQRASFCNAQLPNSEPQTSATSTP
ncbi:MAG: GUN4 domain-containing protein [Thermosynechococcaceae cyanobacterium]